MVYLGSGEGVRGEVCWLLWLLMNKSALSLLIARRAALCLGVRPASGFSLSTFNAPATSLELRSPRV